MQNIILIGSPYSGKSTQCRNISSLLGLLHLPTGEILRAEIQNKTSIGIETENTVTKGLFAPDIILRKYIVNTHNKDIAVKRGDANALIQPTAPPASNISRRWLASLENKEGIC